MANYAKFGYQPKAVQWQKLLDYAFQYKFMIKNWPDDVLPIGPEFHPHNLSSQYLKLLIVPFIKRKAHSYYEAKLHTEAESLFEIDKKKSKGKHQGQGHTMEDVMSELDVDVPEIEFIAWPDVVQECLKQLNDKLMKHIQILTKCCQVIMNLLSLSPPTLPSNQCPPMNFTAVHRHEENYLPQVPDSFDCEPRPALPMSKDEPIAGGRQQTSPPFKVKKALWVDPTFVYCMEERPTNSRNDADSVPSSPILVLWLEIRELFLLGYSFKISYLKSLTDCLSRDSGGDDGINRFGDLDCIYNLPS
ncbi:hypothetical protein BD769DRAFT_1382416 [Suillus cothurnatus]|nr:hypothetical protein BD769DRAFT_1382416 [Suillus cothurnatus]